MLRSCILASMVAAWVLPAAADTTEAQCEIYPAGSDQLDKAVGCIFGQRQGFVTITRADGVTHELSPVDDTPGNYQDQEGRAVYRESGLGDLGQIFRFPDISIFLYWGAADTAAGADGNPTAPFSTDDYDATAVLRCDGVNEADQCPAGIARMEDEQASITVLDRAGNSFTLNFMKDYSTGQPYVNATGSHEVAASLEGDSWTVTVDGAMTFEVPMAAITGD